VPLGTELLVVPQTFAVHRTDWTTDLWWLVAVGALNLIAVQMEGMGGILPALLVELLVVVVVGLPVLRQLAASMVFLRTATI
jgi:hypothetical protein